MLFWGSQNIEISSNLVDGALHYASGLPLALGVLVLHCVVEEKINGKAPCKKIAKVLTRKSMTCQR